MIRIPVKLVIKKKTNKTKKGKASPKKKMPLMHIPTPSAKPHRPVGRAMPPVDHSFTRALICPFAEGTLGVKVPDMYAFETNSFHIKTTLLATGVSSGGFAFFANPFHTLWDLGLQSGGLASLASPGGFIPLSVTGVYGATTPTLLSAVCNDWRLVSCGIRIRNLQPELTATGRLFVATVPTAAGGTPNYNQLANATGVQPVVNAAIRLGLPPIAIMNSPAIQELPSSRDYVVGQLIGEESLYINHQVFHPDFYRFKPSAENNSATAGFSEFDEVIVQNGTNLVSAFQSGNKELTQSDGSSAIIVYWEGIPTTPAINPWEFDVVYHFETTPRLSTQTATSNTGITPVPDSAPKSYSGSTALLETSINVANQADNIISLATEAKNTLQAFDRTMGGMPSKIGKAALNLLPGGFGKKISKFFGF